MKILLLSKYPRIGASSRLRSLQYVPALEENNFSVTIQSLFDEQYIKKLYSSSIRSKTSIIRLYLKRFLIFTRIYRYDLIWIEYEIFPYLPAFIERFLKIIRIPYVVDYDDAIFHNYGLSKNPYVQKFLKYKIDVVMRLSRHVIAGNAYLAEYAKHAGAKKVTVIPTVVDYARYSRERNIQTDQLIIGWIGSPSTQKYLIAIYPSLLAACSKYKAKLLLIGASIDVKEKLKGIDVEVIPWSEDNEVSYIQKMDIGIMPLNDGPWEKGKCGYKLIQYMACGVAVVASPIGVNYQLVVDNNAGLVASTLSNWRQSLFTLLKSPTLRHNFGQNGRQSVLSKYTLQAQLPTLIQVLYSASKQSKY